MCAAQPVMTVRRARALRRHTCDRKDRLGQRAARDLATTIRADTGDAVSAYRCPFCRSWHVGKTPSVGALSDIGRAIRTLAQFDDA